MADDSRYIGFFCPHCGKEAARFHIVPNGGAPDPVLKPEQEPSPPNEFNWSDPIDAEMPVERLHPRCAVALRKAKCETIGDVTRLTYDQVYKILGTHTDVIYIKRRLYSRGRLKLAGPRTIPMKPEAGYPKTFADTRSPDRQETVLSAYQESGLAERLKKSGEHQYWRLLPKVIEAPPIQVQPEKGYPKTFQDIRNPDRRETVNTKDEEHQLAARLKGAAELHYWRLVAKDPMPLVRSDPGYPKVFVSIRDPTQHTIVHNREEHQQLYNGRGTLDPWKQLP